MRCKNPSRLPKRKEKTKKSDGLLKREKSDCSTVAKDTANESMKKTFIR